MNSAVCRIVALIFCVFGFEVKQSSLKSSSCVRAKISEDAGLAKVDFNFDMSRIGIHYFAALTSRIQRANIGHQSGTRTILTG